MKSIKLLWILNSFLMQTFTFKLRDKLFIKDLDLKQIKIPKEVPKKFHPQKEVALNLIPKHKSVVIKDAQNGKFTLPVMIQAKAPKIDCDVYKSQRRGIDFVLVVDQSGSMNHQSKLGLVKDSIDFILEEIKPKDRLLIIKFNQHSAVLLEFKQIFSHTKNSVSQHIRKNLKAHGSTNILKAVDKAIYKIQHRKDKSRRVGFIFLSDGIDTFGNLPKTVKKRMLYLQNLQSLRGLAVCSFSYGFNKYVEMMDAISFHSGFPSFHVQQVNDVMDNIGFCLGNLVSSYGQHITINFKPVSHFKFKIRKNYNDDIHYFFKNYVKKISGISLEKHFNILGDLSIDADKFRCNPNQKIHVMNAHMAYYLENHKKLVQKKLYLTCNMKGPNPFDFSYDIEREIVKDSAVNELDKAKQILDKTKNTQQALISLNKFVSNLNSNLFVSNAVKNDMKKILNIDGISNNKYKLNRSILREKTFYNALPNLAQINSFQKAYLKRAREFSSRPKNNKITPRKRVSKHVLVPYPKNLPQHK